MVHGRRGHARAAARAQGRPRAPRPPGSALGSLCEYMVQKRYKLRDYYVRMSKTSPCTPMSVSNSVFCVGGTQWVVLSAAYGCLRVTHLCARSIMRELGCMCDVSVMVGGK